MERPRRISSFLTRHFELDGPLGQQKLFISRASEATESASSILRATRILKAGMILLMASDVRWTGAHTVTESFLGRSFEFSSTWALLAGMTGAPVVPVFCRILPEGRYRVEFLEPWTLPREVARGDRIAEFVRKSLALIETRVQSDPANCNEYARWLEIEDGLEVERTRNAA
jgi:KDO2-lipid IV(A) lauroyltransferase